MGKIFLGKPVHWLVLVIVLGALTFLGLGLYQTRSYNLFLAILLIMTALSVVIILITTKKDEQVTREPFDDDGA